MDRAQLWANRHVGSRTKLLHIIRNEQKTYIGSNLPFAFGTSSLGLGQQCAAVEEYEYRHVDSKPALSARSFDEFLQELAHSLLHRPKHRNRVEIIVGSALEILHELTTSVQQGTRQPFDFFFIDADKENNYEYVDFACQLASPGACVIVDNMVRRGELARDDLDDPKVAGNRRLVEKPRGDGRIDAVVMQVVGEKNYDGFLMGVVKEGVKKGK